MARAVTACIAVYSKVFLHAVVQCSCDLIAGPQQLFGIDDGLEVFELHTVGHTADAFPPATLTPPTPPTQWHPVASSLALSL